MRQTPYERFAELVRLPDEKIDLIEAALAIATEAYPDLDVAHYLQKFDILAQKAQEHLKDAHLGKDRVEQLCDFLFKFLE